MGERGREWRAMADRGSRGPCPLASVGPTARIDTPRDRPTICAALLSAEYHAVAGSSLGDSWTVPASPAAMSLLRVELTRAAHASRNATCRPDSLRRRRT